MPSDAHPQGLSIREREVFRLVREGRLDAEIGIRIGIGAGEVKQTITVLMSKCGVSERSGLITWEPEKPESARRPWMERLADRMGASVGGIVVTAIIIGMALIFLWRAVSGEDEPVDFTGATVQQGQVIISGASQTPTTTPTP